ncbi:hypothetical protein QQS45_13875 [Alteriqipengyuania flavescens]|uniref:hypothetical protein n=1 Tax=Alteriqipengyuania flavescens TaxID=3053610 RepID=UPI0025B3D1DA|nr:hypothetical protein [Alteriqipengyuania flavescens]WJY18670.1 hypothetical protein QQW98_13870 [Alteriqipengyuania flavescens]WJY24610.1 hypothetical protein QQS45_13875 [Alteriqipengyuania flavescens]
MARADPLIAEWLRKRELVEAAENAGAAAAWGEFAADVLASSSLALRVDAAAEAARQRDFFAQALTIETIEVPGRRAALVGTAQKIACEEPGYEAAPAVFVIGAEEREGGVTLLAVLRRVED